MLVLTRKPNQSIMIGDDIEVSVLSVVGEKVRIGIHAPHDIPVFRTEIYVEIQREGGEQASPSKRGRPHRGGRRAGQAGRVLLERVSKPVVCLHLGAPQVLRHVSQPSSRYSVRNMTTVTTAAVSISVSTSSTKRTEPRL